MADRPSPSGDLPADPCHDDPTVPLLADIYARADDLRRFGAHDQAEAVEAVADMVEQWWRRYQVRNAP